MKGYGQCFANNACVQFIGADGQLEHYALDQFLAAQSKSLRTSPHRLTEVPESIDIRFESKLARAVVYWKLTAGATKQFGYDHFTLAKSRGQWRIANLIFYAANPPPQSNGKLPAPKLNR